MSPRCCANGLNTPPSPPAHEKNEISLIGQMYGVASCSLSRFAASRAKAANLSTD